MSAHNRPAADAPLDLSRWRKVPNLLIGAGGLLAFIGWIVNAQQFGYSWLSAYMFYLSFCLGALFLVLVHHLFDASWSVPIRRLVEHLACLAGPVMALLFIPIAVLAPKIYEWMRRLQTGEIDHSLHAKQPLFTMPMFYVTAVGCFVIWFVLSNRLRYWSLRQDETGSAECTYKMRFYSFWGIFAFALTLTLAAIMWMKALQHEWFSTMYGVWYFAASVWVALPTIYLIAVILKRQGPLRDVVQEKQIYFIGSLMLAFTVFWAYISFGQYFIIWNANIPEETFWYVLREKGTWWDVSMIIIFFHFFLPFLMLLRIDWKLKLTIMIPLCAWGWLMHFFDVAFNILPAGRPEGYSLNWAWLDLGCLAFIGGLLTKVFLKNLNAHPAFPQKDPRLAEGLDIYVPPASAGKAAAASHGGAK
ncbi:MAG: hypothetical protein DME23_24960 [Verrucomicrobia bacterium]|nr:MAG: hypothetical protein DME23_24960 [Verrucomicrobiota bacterium]